MADTKQKILEYVQKNAAYMVCIKDSRQFSTNHEITLESVSRAFDWFRKSMTHTHGKWGVPADKDNILTPVVELELYKFLGLKFEEFFQLDSGTDNYAASMLFLKGTGEAFRLVRLPIEAVEFLQMGVANRFVFLKLGQPQPRGKWYAGNNPLYVSLQFERAYTSHDEFTAVIQGIFEQVVQRKKLSAEDARTYESIMDLQKFDWNTANVNGDSSDVKQST